MIGKENGNKTETNGSKLKGRLGGKKLVNNLPS